MKNRVMNLNQVQFHDVEENGQYTSSRGRSAIRFEAKKLGDDLAVLPQARSRVRSTIITAKGRCS